MFSKVILSMLILVGYSLASFYVGQQFEVEKMTVATKQFHAPDATRKMAEYQVLSNNFFGAGWLIVLGVIMLIWWTDAKKLFKLCTAVAVLSVGTGCLRPIEPIKLEEISSHEEAFLIPYTGDTSVQEASNSAEFLKKNLVFTKQVRIPQQWIPLGREWIGPNGKWHDAALLIRVDVSPVTKEWTADVNSGTSAKNEAIWVMTADSIEFSTGWTVTAKIEDRDNAIKFLHNYRNGTLATIMDLEIRAKIQGEFGLEVTDLPMETLRKGATPHLTKIINVVKGFFKEKGITITNIGITGGFVYKNASILEKMVQVFNAEQEKDIAISKTKAQEEMNKAIIFKAQGEADAILKTKKAEADGIKLLADAKLYELEKAKENTTLYVQLKQIELQKEQLMKWDGRFPLYFMGTSSNTPSMLLQMPPIGEKAKKD